MIYLPITSFSGIWVMIIFLISVCKPIFVHLISMFVKAISEGEWSTALDLLGGMEFIEGEEGKKEVLLLLRKEKYLGLVEQRKFKEGLICLREEVAPLCLVRKLH